MSTLEERALADSDDSDRFAGTQRDTLTSFIKTSGALVKVTAERDALRAALAESEAEWQAESDARDQDFADYSATIERVRALLGRHNGPLWAVRGVRESDIRAALEPTS